MDPIETHMHRGHYQDVVDQFEAGSRRIRNQVRNVVELLRIEPGDVVLEIGVGSGKFTSLISRSNEVFGIDLSEESIDVARRTIARNGLPGNASLVVSRCEWLPFGSARFDQALCIDFVEHLTDGSFDLLLADLRRVLRPGGRVSIYTPNRKHIFEYFRKPPPGHIGLRTPRETCRFLERHGFHVDESYTRPSHFPIFNRIEHCLTGLPLLGIFFQKRICIVASKTD